MAELNTQGSSDTIEPTLTPAWLRWLGLALLALVVSAFAWWPALAAFKNTQFGDGQYFHKFVETVRISIVRYHELPLWDPYECGGRPLWDNPQSLAAAPLALLTVVLGTTFTMKLWYIAHGAMGFVSMWIFARSELRVGRSPAFAASCAWAFSGFMAHHLSGGHSAFAAFEYMPLALYFWRSAERDLRFAIGLGLIVALTIFEGGALPLLYLAVLLAAETLTRLWPVRRIVAIVKAGAVTLAVAMTVGAVRFFPVMDQLRSHKRPLPVEHDSMDWAVLFDGLVNRALPHQSHIPNHGYVWSEYGCYIGLLLLVLALIGLAMARLERLWLVALGGLALILMFGDKGHYSPWAILNRHVYPFKELRVPSRFCAQLVLVLVSFAALAMDRLPAALQKVRALARYPELPRALGAAAMMLGLAGAGDVLGRCLDLTHQMAASDGPAHPEVTPSSHIYFGGPGLAGYIDQPAQNRGRVQCYDPWAPYEGAAVWEGDVPQARSAAPTAQVTGIARTQNTFSFDVDAEVPSKILLNSAFDLNWRSSVGKPVEENKALTIEVPAGHNHVVVRYWPRLLTLGFFVSLLGSVLTVLYYRRLSRQAS